MINSTVINTIDTTNVIQVGLAGYIIACILGVLLVAARKPRLWNYTVHSITAVSSLLVALASLYNLLTAHKTTIVLQFSGPLRFLPPLYMVVDPLSSFMAFVVSLVAFYASIFAIGYVDEYYKWPGKLGLLGLCLPSFVGSMILVAFAGDAISFIVSWEVMSVTSFFLILTEFEKAEVRRAGIVYMIYAAFSAICLLAAFALGYAFTDQYVFNAWKLANMTASQAWLIFLLALLGFSAKAGVVPLHSWLPQAHPAAPSHVSALLSGVMVKLAMYGIVRIALDALAPWVSSGWGVIILVLGAISTFYGVALAIIQHDIKRLLAYHTIENIGIIMLGIGVAVSAHALHNYALAVLGIIAGLFHLLNHALFKSLLFLCSGALLHQLHTRDIEMMGGLYNRLRATALAFLIGALGITAVPLFNGFASEWCTYNSLILAIGGLTRNLVVRFASLASILSLSAAGVLAVYCFTKVFGVVFLGVPRTERAKKAHVEPVSMKISYIVPSLMIILLGVAPGLIVVPLASVGATLFGKPISPVEIPMLGMLVKLWDAPSAYIPLLITAAISVVAIITWAYALSKVRYTAITEPFVSGVAYDEEAMAPTPLLYVGTLEDIMSRFYGVKREYVREYAVEHWVSKRVEAIEKPQALLAKLIQKAGFTTVDLAKLPEKLDDMFYAAFRVVGRASVSIAKAITRIQCGSIHVYLLYIYIAFFALLLYYAFIG